MDVSVGVAQGAGSVRSTAGLTGSPQSPPADEAGDLVTARLRRPLWQPPQDRMPIGMVCSVCSVAVAAEGSTPSVWERGPTTHWCSLQVHFQGNCSCA